MDKIAAIGDSDSLFAYKIMGADVYNADMSNAKEILKEAINKSYSIILVTVPLFRHLSSYIDNLDENISKLLIPIPSLSEKDNFESERIDKFVETAVGSKII